MMKLAIFIISVFVSTTAFSQLRVKTSTNNLGDIFEGNGIVVSNFEVQNPYYQDTIQITNVNTSCGCTAIIAHDTLIYPRQSIVLKVTYDPTERVGLFQKTIHIETLTGGHEKNSLYLKIVGNVVGEAKTKTDIPVELIDYKVAPIYFFPITQYDTSFFGLNRITDFSNDITFEIDYYNFTTLGIEIRVRDKSLIEDFETMSSFLKRKLMKEMIKRQYAATNITFIDPIFIYDNTIPSWSAGQVKLYSVKFNDDKIKESVIKMTNQKVTKKSYFLLDYNFNITPTSEQLVNLVDYKSVNTKLFRNGKIELNAVVYVPESLGRKAAIKMAKKFRKTFYKKMKETSGISKDEFSVNFDTLSTHASTKYKFQMYDRADKEGAGGIKYKEKPEDVLIPLLPTYKTEFFTKNDNLDIESTKFDQFWNAIIAYANTGKNLQLTIESSSSKYPKKTIC